MKVKSPFKAQEFEFGINKYQFAAGIWDKSCLNFEKIYFKLCLKDDG